LLLLAGITAFVVGLVTPPTPLAVAQSLPWYECSEGKLTRSGTSTESEADASFWAEVEVAIACADYSGDYNHTQCCGSITYRPSTSLRDARGNPMSKSTKVALGAVVLLALGVGAVQLRGNRTTQPTQESATEASAPTAAASEREAARKPLPPRFVTPPALVSTVPGLAGAEYMRQYEGRRRERVAKQEHFTDAQVASMNRILDRADAEFEAQIAPLFEAAMSERDPAKREAQKKAAGEALRAFDKAQQAEWAKLYDGPPAPGVRRPQVISMLSEANQYTLGTMIHAFGKPSTPRRAE
jgi:hypothetical protein